MNSIDNINLIIAKAEGKRESVRKMLSASEEELSDLKRRQKNLDECQAIIQQVAQSTQKNIEYRISEIVSLALDAVFDDPYQFAIEFVQKRGRTEAEIYFMKNGEKFYPMDDSGGGAVDVASFALRVALWNIGKPKTRNTILLDEPFRFLSKDLQSRAGDMLSEISKKLGLQFILVTHVEDIVSSADKEFVIAKNKKGSYLK